MTNDDIKNAFGFDWLVLDDELSVQTRTDDIEDFKDIFFHMNESEVQFELN